MSNATFEDLRLGKMQDGPTIKSCRGRGGLVEVCNHPCVSPCKCANCMLVVGAEHHLSADHWGRHGADAATRRRGPGVAPALATDGLPMC